MTTQPAVSAALEPLEIVRDRTVIVDVPADSRMEQLLCLHDTLKAKKEAANEAWDDFQDGLFTELVTLHPDKDIKIYQIPKSPMYPGLAYGYQESDYLPGPMVREHMPPVWDAFKKVKKSWVLRKTGKR
jgi:hypothetical protein